jgi:hypothetical protein
MAAAARCVAGQHSATGLLEHTLEQQMIGTHGAFVCPQVVDLLDVETLDLVEGNELGDVDGVARLNVLHRLDLVKLIILTTRRLLLDILVKKEIFQNHLTRHVGFVSRPPEYLGSPSLSLIGVHES